jgi:acyl-CoA synthetase (AMP-forming)/AMP-acid ligase II
MSQADFSFEPLTPTAFLRRAARVYGDRIGVIDGDVRFSYAQFLQRALKFAGALKQLGVAPGDRVALLAGNSHVLLCAHYAVPFAGAALVALNTRITPSDTAYILQHSGSTVLIYDAEFAAAAKQAAADLGPGIRLVLAGGANDELETLIDAAAAYSLPVEDERSLLAINYTSGTTARPKGVMYHHRGRTEWQGLSIPDQARLKSRQGVSNVISCEVRVVDDQGRDVPADAQTMGEIAMRGNNLMLGYYQDEEATRKACPDGWFRTGDLGVMHPDFYIELRDRAKDIIISGGENISSVEIEQALATHPAVLEVAVVAAADEKWGEVPVAFVALKKDAQASSAELTEHVRAQLARFKAPKRIVFGPLPKTSTGKVQKNVLRDRLKNTA